MISLDISSNRQVLMRKEVTYLYNCGEISKSEYVEKMKEALECTVPYKKVVLPGKKYLTNEEIACIQNITLEIDWTFEEMQECVLVLREICEKAKYPVNYVRMYQFIMSAVSSYLGNLGNYEESDKIKNTIIGLLLENRKLYGIHEAMYGRMWNKEQKLKYNKSVLQECRTELEKCFQISKLCKDYERSTLYEERLIAI